MLQFYPLGCYHVVKLKLNFKKFPSRSLRDVFYPILFQVMEMLLKIPADYWEQFVNIKLNEDHCERNENRDEFGEYTK